MRAPSKTRKQTEGKLLSAAALLAAALGIGVLSYQAGKHSATGRLETSPTASSHQAAVDAAVMRSHRLSSAQPTTGIAGTNGTISRSQTGRHIMLDYYNIPGRAFPIVADTKGLLRTVSQLVHHSNMHLLGHSCHVFVETQGITCVFLLSESHLSIHTWPELGFAAVDIYTCGKQSRPEVMEHGLAGLLEPGITLRQEQARGTLNISALTPDQKEAKVLHNMLVNDEENDWEEGLRQMLHQVPILYSYSSPYQLIQVVAVRGQMGRCLLLNRIIQFCSHDLDAYTDHMARQPLQMLQRLHGCTETAAALLPTDSTAAGSTEAGYGAVTATYPLAGSDPIPEHVSCRSHLLHPLVSTAASSTVQDGGAASSRCTQQQKARVLIVGGGDGWIAKQLVECYGDWVSSVNLVEIDRGVSEVTERFFGQGKAGGTGQGSAVNPFKHPSIHWNYTDAFVWAQQQAAQCGGAMPGANGGNAGSFGDLHAAEAGRSAAQTATAKRSRRHLGTSSSSAGCATFDIVIIDSTDFTQQAASVLHSAAFYRALYQLMSPKAALIQLVEIYMRGYERPFSAIEAAMGDGGWISAGRSSVYNPSYGGQTVFLQAVKV